MARFINPAQGRDPWTSQVSGTHVSASTNFTRLAPQHGERARSREVQASAHLECVK